MNRVGMLVAVVAVIAVAVVGVGMLVNHGLPGFLSWASADSPEKARAAAMDGRERVFREQFKLSDECVKAALEATKAPTTKSHSKDGKSHIEKWSFSCDGGKQTVLLTETDCKYVWTLAPKPAAKAVARPAPAPVPAPPAVAAPPAPQAPAVSQEVRVNVGPPDAAPRVAVTESPQAPSTVRQVVQVNVAGSPPVTVAAPVPPVVPPPPAPVAMAPAGCPDWRLNTHLWSYKSLPPAKQKEVDTRTAAAKKRPSHGGTVLSAYLSDAVSRTMGKRLREEVKTTAPVDMVVHLKYLNTEKGTLERDLGALPITAGMGGTVLPGDPRWFILEVVFPDEVMSPTKSGTARRLLVFPREWGEHCEMNVHGIVP